MEVNVFITVVSFHEVQNVIFMSIELGVCINGITFHELYFPLHKKAYRKVYS